jgi:tRNA U34 5-carboxymethylaminomethyl modifying GTPase MnmE/TrmE
MSGGYFNGGEFRLLEIAESIDNLIKYNTTYNEYGQSNDYKEETIEHFKNTSNMLKMLYVYVHRIDYLVECDDSEETFHTRLEEDLALLMKELNET